METTKTNTVDENLRKLSVYPWPEDGSFPKQYITFTDDTVEISEKTENNMIVMRSYKHYLWEIMLILNKADDTVGMMPIRPIMEDNIKEIFSDPAKLHLLVMYPWKKEEEIQNILWTIDDILENPMTLNIEGYDPRKKDKYTIRDYLGEDPDKTWKDFGPDNCRDDPAPGNGNGPQEAY
jgi:hypothetical protein